MISRVLIAFFTFLQVKESVDSITQNTPVAPPMRPRPLHTSGAFRLRGAPGHKQLEQRSAEPKSRRGTDRSQRNELQQVAAADLTDLPAERSTFCGSTLTLAPVDSRSNFSACPRRT